MATCVIILQVRSKDGEDGETWIVNNGSVKETVEKYYDCPKCGGQNTFYIKENICNFTCTEGGNKYCPDGVTEIKENLCISCKWQPALN